MFYIVVFVKDQVSLIFRKFEKVCKSLQTPTNSPAYELSSLKHSYIASQNTTIMTLFLQFGSQMNAPHAPTLQDSSGITEHPRPFVPSVAPEDLEKAMEVGILSPKSVTAADMEPTPFVPRPLTWANRADPTKGSDPEKDHIKTHQDFIDDIEFLQMISEQEGDDDEDMLNDAADWLEDQEKILWAPQSGVPSIMHQSFAIAQAEFHPLSCTQEIKVVRVEPTWSLASIAGNMCVYLPWGSKTNFEGPPGVVQPLLNQKPLRHNEFVFADLVWNPQGKNFWKVTKVYPKLPTSEMLVSTVESVSDYGKKIVRSGWQYTYEIPCDPENIGNIIGSGGKNINSIIHNIQKVRENFWTGPLPPHIYDEESTIGNYPLPEVTITPIVQDPNEFVCSFRPTKARVRVYLPTCCIWDQKQVNELVSYMHS